MFSAIVFILFIIFLIQMVKWFDNIVELITDFQRSNTQKYFKSKKDFWYACIPGIWWLGVKQGWINYKAWVKSCILQARAQALAKKISANNQRGRSYELKH